MNNANNGAQKWKEIRQSLNLFLLIGALLGGLFSYWKWQWTGLLAQEGILLCLALGLWLTDNLIKVFTKVKHANPTAIALLFLGKLAWWGGIFLGARMLPRGSEAPVGLGIGIFLFSLALACFRHYGMPRISDRIPPSDP